MTRTIQEGDQVARGTVLARLREDEFETGLRKADSQLAEAKSTLAHSLRHGGRDRRPGIDGRAIRIHGFPRDRQPIGVIVSHVIVLFDYIEGRSEQGAPLEQALLDAGIARLQPVMITVGSTIFGLIPLAIHGGPFWESMCYAQIGGQAIANYITKLLAPAPYAIFALDLKLIEWSGK